MSDENENSHGLFANYTEANCHFENKYLMAAKMLDCIPWSMPRMDGEGRPVCNEKKSAEFRKRMMDHDRNRTCLQDCTQLEFQFIATTDTFNPEAVCPFTLYT